MMRVKKVFPMIIVLALVMSLVPTVMAQGKIDLNAATTDELVQIKGIGEKYAQRIIEYREKNGPFRQIEDIMKVKGIGPKTFESIKESLIIESSEE